MLFLLNVPDRQPPFKIEIYKTTGMYGFPARLMIRASKGRYWAATELKSKNENPGIGIDMAMFLKTEIERGYKQHIPKRIELTKEETETLKIAVVWMRRVVRENGDQPIEWYREQLDKICKAYTHAQAQEGS